MFVLKRNQVIITALVLMIAVAGFLSWSDARTGELTVGYLLTDQGEIAALIPDSGTLAGLFPENYEGIVGAPWVTTHDPAIAVSGDDFTAWYNLSNLELSELIAASYQPNDVSEAGEAIFVNANRDSYFLQNRLTREQSRSSARMVLDEIVRNDNISDEQRAEAVEQMMEIQNRIRRETDVEALIEAKGFTEAYVRISETSVDVLVSKEALTEAELAQIVEIIKRKTGMDITQIHVSPMRR